MGGGGCAGCVWTGYPTPVMHHRESTAYRTSIGERDGPSIVSRKSEKRALEDHCRFHEKQCISSKAWALAINTVHHC